MSQKMPLLPSRSVTHHAQHQQMSPTNNPQPSDVLDNPQDLVLYCCVCFLPLSAAQQPDPKESTFWLTSCGHVVCGTHVFPEGLPPDAPEKTHNCPYCHHAEVSVAAVSGGKPPEGLTDYFTPQTELLENVVGALRFRDENLIRIASHYKDLSGRLSEKLENQKSVLLRVKDELIEARELKKSKEQLEEEVKKLREENQNLRSQLEPGQPKLDNHPQHQTVQNNGQSEKPPAANGSSPFTISSDHDDVNPLKRKAGEQEGQGSRVRDFRRELNGRHIMAPPASSRPLRRSPIQPPPPPPPMIQGQRSPSRLHQLSGYDNPGDDSNYSGPYQSNFTTLSNTERDEFFPHVPQTRFQDAQQSHTFFNNNMIQSVPQRPATPPRSFSRTNHRQPIPGTPRPSYANAPFRTPLSRPQTFNTSYRSPPVSRPSIIGTGVPNNYQHLSPLATGARLTLAPSTSHGGTHRSPIFSGMGRREERSSSNRNMVETVASPFFNRQRDGPQVGTNGASEFIQRDGRFPRPETSASFRTNGGSSLGEILRGTGGVTERPGLRRAVRRD